MPEMSGEEVLAKLKENPNFNTPVIALTADALSGAKEKYLALGFADYIAKPFSREQIKEKLDVIFNSIPKPATYVFDAKTNEEYVIKNGKREDCN